VLNQGTQPAVSRSTWAPPGEGRWRSIHSVS
jgi:hypothetical protein